MQLSTLLPLVLLPLLPAQQDRVTAVVTVRTQDGKPWEGATVRLVSNFHPGVLEGRDLVEARSDERGRVQVRLLPGRRYSAWAAGAVGPHHYRVTDVVDGVHVKGNVDLVASAPRKRLRVQVDGLAPWRKAGPFRALVSNLGEMRTQVECEVAADGTFVGPMLPTSNGFLGGTVLIFDRERRFLRMSRFTERIVRDGVLAIPLDPPVEVRCRVRTSAGDPVAGATISRYFDSRSFVSATTGQDGIAEFQLPIPMRARRGGEIRIRDKFHVRAAGFADTYSTARSVARGGEEPDVEFTLRKASKLRGRLLLGEDKPAASMPLLLYTSFDVSSGSNRALLPFVFATDAEGRFSIDTLAPKSDWRLLAAHAPLVWIGGGEAGSAREHDFGEIRLDRLRELAIEVRAATDERGRHAQLILGEPGARRRDGIWPVVPLVTDRLGRARLLFRGSATVGLAASWRGAAGSLDVDLAELSKARNSRVLELPPMRVIHGKLFAEGEPVAGAKVAILRRRSRGEHGLIYRLPMWYSVVSGADGSFAIPAVDGQSRISADKLGAGDRGMSLSGRATVTVDGENPKPIRIDMTLTRRRGGAARPRSIRGR